MLSDDPEAPTTIKHALLLRRRSPAGTVTRLGRHRRRLDRPLDPAPADADVRAAEPGAWSTRPPRRRGRQASNFLVVAPKRSATGNTLAVMGPQLGYYYPEIVAADGPPRAGHPGAGRRRCRAWRCTSSSAARQNYAWSLTSADHDVRDVFAEQLCEPDGSAPTRASTTTCSTASAGRSTTFDAGTLNGTPIRYPTSVHGPVIGTATVGGKPYALTRQRSTFGRDGLNLAALKDMTDGQGVDAAEVLPTSPTSSASRSTGPTRRATTTAYFSSGLLPRARSRARPAAADARHRRVRVAAAS